MNEIYRAFEAKLNTITPLLSTAFENAPFSPVNNVPYQELFLIPAMNDDEFRDGYLAKGIFQINLKYPVGKGTKDILDRVKLYLDNFKIGTTLTKDGIVTNIDRTPTAKSLGVIGDRLCYAISITYWADYENDII